jgi:hypothetical protein
VAGALHTREFRVTDMETACLTPGKLMAATVVDLLADGARRAKALCADFTPRLAKDEYLALLNKLTRNTVA